MLEMDSLNGIYLYGLIFAFCDDLFAAEEGTMQTTFD